jgi:hypothetical protein
MRRLLPTVVILFSGVLYLSCQPKDQPPAAKASINTPVQPSAEASVNTINLDKSPLDMSYYPVEYPKLKMTGTANEDLVARVIYSRPKKEGRAIFGNVLQFGSKWRLGANEATEIEFFKDVMIQKKLIKKNRYVIYCIPYADKWTIILNNDLFIWGLKIDATKDVYKFDIPVITTAYPLEYFTMTFEKGDPGINLVMAWDSVRTMLPITY